MEEMNEEDDRDSLKEEDIAVRKFNINMGKKHRNPLECVSFYREKNGVYQLVKKRVDEISMMMPEKCQATLVRLFVKNEDKF